MNQQLHRSERHRIIGGVCSGLAESFGGSAWLYRLAFIAGTILTHGALIILYPALWIFLPSQSRLDHRYLESRAGSIGRLTSSAEDVWAATYRPADEVRGAAPAAGCSKPMDKLQDELLRMSDGAVEAYQRWRARQSTRPTGSTDDVIKVETEVIEPAKTVDQASETATETGPAVEKTEPTGTQDTP